MDLQAFLPGIETLLKEVGDYLLGAQRGMTGVEKAPGDPVSDADREAQRLLREGLAKLLPEAEFRGEEASWSTWPATSWCWVVDPIDGTEPYLEGEGEWTVSVALLRGGEPMLGAIRMPARDETYLAVRGGGATLDGAPLRVNDVPVERARVLASVRRGKMLEDAGLLERLPGASVGGAYATTILCARVARGEAEAYVQFSSTHTREWDVAAAALIVEEAGGRATDLDGRPIRFDKEDPLMGFIVISNSACHDGLLAALRELELPGK